MRKSWSSAVKGFRTSNFPDEKFLLRRVTPLDLRNFASFVMFVVFPDTGVISLQRIMIESSVFE